MAKIIGNTTATPNPRPDWLQTDATKADYIKNKPETVTVEQVREIIAESGAGESSGDGMVYKNIDISIDSVHSWKYYAKSDSIHVLIPESGKAVAVSQDGRAWKTYALPEERTWSGLAYGNGKFLIVSPTSSTAYISENGIDWSSVTLPHAVCKYTTHSHMLNANSVIFYQNCFYVACQQSSQGIIIKSSDGMNWTSVGYPHTEETDTLIISCADDLCYISQYDGNTWETQTFKLLADDTFTNLGRLSDLYRLVGKCDNKYYAVIYCAEGFGMLCNSTDGTGWSGVSETYLDSLDNINATMNDSTIITWGSGSGEYAYLYTDGAWDSLDGLDFSLSTVLWNGTEFVAINDMIVRTSPDGLSWHQGGIQWIEQAGEDITNDVKTLLTPDALAYYHTDVTYEKTSWNIRRLTHGSVTREDGTTGNRFVAIYAGRQESDWVWDEETGEEYEVTTYYNPEMAAYSDDGLTWHQTSLPVKGDWSDVCHTGEAFIAVAKGSQTLIYSTDGIAWNSMELPILADWTSLARTRNGIIIVSNGNKVLWGEGNIANGFTWTETTLESDDGSELNLSRVCWAVDQGFGIAVGGSKSVIFNSNRQYAIHDLPATGFIDITMITPDSDEDWYFEFYAVTENGELATTAGAYDREYDYSEELPDVSWSLFNTEFPALRDRLVRLIIGNGDNGDGTYQNYLIFNRFYCYNGNDLVEWYDGEYWEYNYVYNIAADYYDGKIIVYGTDYGSHTAICISTDGGLTWNYSYSDLIQKGESVSEGVASAVWDHIAPLVDKKIPAIPDHLDIGSSVGVGHSQGVYNSNLDRIVVQNDYVRYSDDNGKTWIEFEGETKGTVCGAIGNVFVFKDYDVTTTEEEVWVEDESYDGGGYHDIREVTTISRVKIFVHTLETYQEWIECLFKDAEGNTVDLPKQNYRCYNMPGGSGGSDRLVLIGDDKTTAAYSEDGIRWTVATTNFSETHGNLEHIASGNGVLLACSASSQTGEMSVARSLDGINWTTSKVSLVSMPSNAESVEEGLHSLIYGNGIFVCAYDVYYWVSTDTGSRDQVYLQALAISTDGVTWNIQTSPSHFPDVFVGNRFIEIGTYSSYYSTDAINWTMYSDSPQPHPGGGNNTDPDFLYYYSTVSQITPDYVYVVMVTVDQEYIYNYYAHYTTDGYTWKSVEDSTADIIVKGGENVTAQVSSAILTNIMNTYRKIIAPEDWTEDGAVVQFHKTQVTPESIVIVSADINSMTAYEDAGIRCVKQDYGALTFICDTVPSSAVNVNIMIIQAPVTKEIPYIEDPRGEEEEGEEEV